MSTILKSNQTVSESSAMHETRYMSSKWMNVLSLINFSSQVLTVKRSTQFQHHVNMYVIMLIHIIRYMLIRSTFKHRLKSFNPDSIVSSAT